MVGTSSAQKSMFFLLSISCYFSSSALVLLVSMDDGKHIYESELQLSTRFPFLCQDRFFEHLDSNPPLSVACKVHGELLQSLRGEVANLWKCAALIWGNVLQVLCDEVSSLDVCVGGGGLFTLPKWCASCVDNCVLWEANISGAHLQLIKFRLKKLV